MAWPLRTRGSARAASWPEFRELDTTTWSSGCDLCLGHPPKAGRKMRNGMGGEVGRREAGMPWGTVPRGPWRRSGGHVGVGGRVRTGEEGRGCSEAGVLGRERDWVLGSHLDLRPSCLPRDERPRLPAPRRRAEASHRTRALLHRRRAQLSSAAAAGAALPPGSDPGP